MLAKFGSFDDGSIELYRYDGFLAKLEKSEIANIN